MSGDVLMVQVDSAQISRMLDTALEALDRADKKIDQQMARILELEGRVTRAETAAEEAFLTASQCSETLALLTEGDH